MLTLAIKSILILFGALMVGMEAFTAFPVAVFLIALTVSALNSYFQNKRFTIASSAAFFILCVFFPQTSPYVPLFCYDMFVEKKRYIVSSAAIPLFLYARVSSITDAFMLALLMTLAIVTRYICDKAGRLSQENKLVRDNSFELNRMLVEKNEHLIERQNYEINLATLTERNRIAREIHDNMGHLLTRSILQTGALLAINTDERLTESISELKDTLSNAMDGVRKSVHGLREESLDLYGSIYSLTEHLNYEINIDYDTGNDLPNGLKYCFLSILKEALTNIARHSDATRIRIAVQEHPAMYQLLIHDNGTKKPASIGTGMGLINMEERVAAFNGRFTTSYQNGFRVFISIPKLIPEDVLYEYNTR